MNIDYRNKVKNYLLNNKKVTREKLRLWLMGIIPSGIAYRSWNKRRKNVYINYCRKKGKEYDLDKVEFNCADFVLSGKKRISYRLLYDYFRNGFLIEKKGFVYLNDNRNNI